MADTPSRLTPRSAQLLHFVMVMSIAAVTGVFWVVRDVVSLDLPDIARIGLRYAALFELVSAGFVVSRMRARMRLQQPDEDVAVWWTENGDKVVTTWTFALGAALTGAVFWLLTRDGLVLAAVVVAALVILLRLGPGHWRAEPTYRSNLAP